MAFTLAGVSLLFAGVGILTGTFDPAYLSAMPNQVYGIMNNQILMAVPLFVFMGVMLEKSRIAERLLHNMGLLFWPSARRLGDFGGARWCADGCQYRNYRRQRSDHGFNFFAHYVAPRLQPRPNHGHYLRHRNAGANYSTVYCADYLGRCAVQLLSTGTAEDGYFQPRKHFRRRSVYGRADSRLDAGADVLGLYRLGGVFRPQAAPAVADRPALDSAFVWEIIKGLVPPLALIIAVFGRFYWALPPTEAAAIGAGCSILLWPFIASSILSA